jgi:hypothetical protein
VHVTFDSNFPFAVKMLMWNAPLFKRGAETTSNISTRDKKFLVEKHQVMSPQMGHFCFAMRVTHSCDSYAPIPVQGVMI